MDRSAVAMCATVLVSLGLTSGGGGTGSPAAPSDRVLAAVALAAAPYALVGSRTLTVAVPVGTGCAPTGTAEVEVVQTPTRVTLRAWVRRAHATTAAQPTTAGSTCSGLRTQPVTVVLEAPVGTRTVLDGVSGRVVPPGAWAGLTA